MGLRVPRIALSLAALAVLATGAVAHARPGDLDDSFGRGGVVLAANDGAFDLLIRPDGRMLVAGSEELRAYLPNGKPDPSFGSGGVADLDPTKAGWVRAAALGRDGRILLAGVIGPSGDGDISVTRLLGDGRPDSSFDSDGYAQYDLGSNTDSPSDIDVDAGGRVLVTGLGRSDPAYPQEFGTFSKLLALLRLEPDGTPDQEFGTDGLAEVSAGPCLSASGESAILADETIVSQAGAAYSVGRPGSPCPEGDLRIIRVSQAGAPDSGFGEEGVARFDLGYAEVPTGLVSRGPNGVLASGRCTGGPCPPYLLAIGSDGQLDATFAGDGRLPAGPVEAVDGTSGSFYAFSPATQTFVGNAFGITKLTDAGTPDASFGRNGSISHDLLRTRDSAAAAELDPAGRVVVMTESGTLARLEAGGRFADRDGDRIADRRDRCPREFSTRRRGCPTIARTATIVVERGGEVSGEIESEVDECVDRQRVQILRFEEGRATLVARLRTRAYGQWKLPRKVDGKFAVRVPRTYVQGMAHCRAVTSYRAETWKR